MSLNNNLDDMNNKVIPLSFGNTLGEIELDPSVNVVNIPSSKPNTKSIELDKTEKSSLDNSPIKMYQPRIDSSTIYNKYQHVPVYLHNTEDIIGKLDHLISKMEEYKPKESVEKALDYVEPTINTMKMNVSDVMDVEFDYFESKTTSNCKIFLVPRDSFKLKLKASTKVVLDNLTELLTCVLIEEPIPIPNTDMDLLIFFIIPTKTVDNNNQV